MKITRLNLGCGITPREGFINVDILGEVEIPEGFEYVKADIHKLPFNDGSIDYIEMMSVLEHIPFREVVKVLREIYRVMAVDADLRILTENFDGLALDWIKMRMEDEFDMQSYISVMETIYGNQKHEGEFHKVAFTPRFLDICLKGAGFTKIITEIIPKNSPVPQLGTVPADDKKFIRSEQLYVLVTK